MPEPGRNLAVDACMGRTQLSPCKYNFSTRTIRASRNAMSAWHFFSCWATYIQIFFGNIHNIVTKTVTNSTGVEPVSYRPIYIIKPTGCQNNPGRVFPLDAAASSLLSLSCLCPIHWSQVLSQEWRCSWAAPTGDAPTTAQWSTILLPTKVGLIMMTSSNGNIFCITHHLCWEFISDQPVTSSLDVFFDLLLYKQLSIQWWGWWFETPSRPLWRNCNVLEV